MEELSKEEEASIPVDEKQEDTDFEYPNAEEINADYVNLTICPETKQTKSRSAKKSTRKYIDFEKENHRNKKLGDQGELIVFHKEKKFLIENGKTELSKKVRLISKINSSAGYDIFSFELDGMLKPIEVKTTSSGLEAVSFHLSAGEYERVNSLRIIISTLCLKQRQIHRKYGLSKMPLLLKIKV